MNLDLDPVVLKRAKTVPVKSADPLSQPALRRGVSTPIDRELFLQRTAKRITWDPRLKGQRVADLVAPASKCESRAKEEQKVSDTAPTQPQFGDDEICVICMVELKDPDTVADVRTLKCGHSFHHGCLSGMLDSSKKKKKKRLLFGWIACPVCRTPMSGYAELDQRLENDLKLYSKVKAVVTYVLEQRREDSAEVFTDVDIQDALNKMKINDCRDCREPYFAGMVGCGPAGEEEEEDAYDSEDNDAYKSMCSRCIFSTDIACSKHGMEFIMFKCILCCRRTPTFNCDTGHYFCTPCHDVCYGSGQARDSICERETCIYKRGHPPNDGRCYSLGCTMCVDTKDHSNWTMATKQEQTEEFRQYYDQHVREYAKNRPRLTAAEKSQLVCRFFLNGKCRNGRKCPFKHEKPVEAHPQTLEEEKGDKK